MVKGTWDVRIWAECPHCGEDVDLADYDNFWGYAKLELADKGPIDATCPNCEEEILGIELEW